MKVAFRIWMQQQVLAFARFVVPFTLLSACACGSEEPPADDTGKASISGAAGDLVFGPSVHAIGGTFYGADDGLYVLVTDARDPCGAGTQERQANTNVLLLRFLDGLGSARPPTSARAGDYTFVTEPFGAGLFFQVSRAFRLDAACARTEPGAGSAVAGAGTLDKTVGLPGGRAEGSFSADFAGGTLSGTFSAPFCSWPVLVDYPEPGDANCVE